MSATHRGLFLSQTSPIGAPNLNTYLTGTVWQTYNGTNPPALYDWYRDIYPTGNDSAFEVVFGTVPPPQVPAFVTAHWPGAATPVWIGLGGQNRCDLDAVTGNPDPDHVRFFKTAKMSGEWSLNVQSGQPMEIYVNGIAVWMFDSGLLTSRTVRVHGTGNDMLVLCAKKTVDPAMLLPYGWQDVGMVFVGGIHSPDLPVILVTDGYVAIDNNPIPRVSQHSTLINWATVYAHFAWIRGPDQAGTYVFRHDPGSHPQAEANLERLLARGLLPNAIAASMSLDFRPKALNSNSRGRWVTALLEPASPFGASDIDIGSIRLNGTIPVDAAAPTAVGDEDEDGVSDLMVKFDRAEVELTVPDGDHVPITATGLVAGYCFSATESVRVRRAVVSTPGPGRPDVSDASAIESPVGVGRAGLPQLALLGATPNPTQRELRVSFSLGDSKKATLALYDIGGRQIVERRVDGMGPGWHTLTLAEQSSLRNGVYVIRLTQEGRSITTRVAVVR